MNIPINGTIGADILTATISLEPLSQNSSISVTSSMTSGDLCIILLLFGLIMLSLLNLFFKKI